MDQDDRFKHVNSDPKFRRLPQKERKVKIDKRFETMFKVSFLDAVNFDSKMQI
jgi:hypothetical protein